MAVVQTTLVEVPFDKGMSTYTNEYLTAIDVPTLIQNGVQLKDGEVKKRYGYTPISHKTVTSTALSDLQKLVLFNKDLTVLSKTNIYTYSPERNFWIDKGTYSLVNVTHEPQIRNSKVLKDADYAENESIGVNIWVDGNDIYASTIDITTNSILLSPTKIYDGSTYPGVQPKVRVAGSHFILLWWISDTVAVDSKLYSRYVSIENPVTLTAQVQVTTAHVDTPDYMWDCVSYRNGILAVWNLPDAVKNMRIGYITQLGALGDATNGYVAAVTTAADIFGKEALTIVTNGDLVFIPYYNSTVGTPSRCLVLRHFLDLGGGSTNWKDVDFTGGMLSNSITAVALTSSSIGVFSSADYTTSPNEVSSRYCTLSIDTVTGDLSAATYSIGSVVNAPQLALASKAFVYNNNTYVTVSYQGGATGSDTDNLQPSYFVVDTAFDVVAKILSGVAGGHLNHTTAINSLPQVTTSTITGEYIFPALQRIRIISQDGRLFSAVGITKITVDFESATISNTQLGQNQHVAGGYLHVYDGTQAVEAGFHTFPEKPTSSSVAGALTGAYSWVGVWEWVDSQGQIHQSAPSAPLTDTVAGEKLTITFYGLPLTDKDNVQLVLYRTLDTGTTYYRVASASATTSTVAFTDEALDATISGNQLLYTTGGVVENIAPPVCRIAIRHGNRVFLAGLEDPNIIWYSRESVENEGVAFSDLLQFRVDPAGGEITALASFDGKLIIFKEDAIFVMTGEGPNDTGGQNNFSQPQTIASHVGCSNQESVAIIPAGLVFKSDKGIYLLDRSLTVVYIGKPVHDYNNLSITSAILLPDENQLRFTTNDGEALVYQHELDRWSVFSNYEAISAISWRGNYYILKNNSKVYKESADTYTDDGAPFSMKIETAWFRMTNQSKMRIYETSLIGKWFSSHILRIRKYINYDDQRFETKYFRTDDVLDVSYFGDEVYWGTSEVFGTPKDRVYQFNMPFDTRSCESFKLVFEDLPVDDSGPSYLLSHLTIKIGVTPDVYQRGKEST